MFNTVPHYVEHSPRLRSTLYPTTLNTLPDYVQHSIPTTLNTLGPRFEHSPVGRRLRSPPMKDPLRAEANRSPGFRRRLRPGCRSARPRSRMNVDVGVTRAVGASR